MSEYVNIAKLYEVSQKGLTKNVSLRANLFCIAITYNQYSVHFDINSKSNSNHHARFRSIFVKVEFNRLECKQILKCDKNETKPAYAKLRYY